MRIFVAVFSVDFNWFSLFQCYFFMIFPISCSGICTCNCQCTMYMQCILIYLCCLFKSGHICKGERMTQEKKLPCFCWEKITKQNTFKLYDIHVISFNFIYTSSYSIVCFVFFGIVLEDLKITQFMTMFWYRINHRTLNWHIQSHWTFLIKTLSELTAHFG